MSELIDVTGFGDTTKRYIRLRTLADVRPWPFGTILRRTAKNLAEITGSARAAKAAEERILVVTYDGRKNFRGLVLTHSSIPVGQVSDQWVAEYWEPDE